ARLSIEPLPVAVAVTEKQFVPGSTKETGKPRLVVFGDAEMISNAELSDRSGALAYDWTTSALDWLSANKTGLVGPRTKEATSYSLNPQKVNVERLAYLPGWLMMLGILGLGAGVWVVRKR